MALQIVERCVNCYACQMVCPTGAIRKTNDDRHFTIKQEKCTECVGGFDDPQCASICPIEEAIVDGLGNPMNPLGTLTGLPTDKAILV